MTTSPESTVRTRRPGLKFILLFINERFLTEIFIGIFGLLQVL